MKNKSFEKSVNINRKEKQLSWVFCSVLASRLFCCSKWNSDFTKFTLPLQQTGLSDVDLTQSEIQEAINAANDLADQHKQSEYTLSIFNVATSKHLQIKINDVFCMAKVLQKTYSQNSFLRRM